jgi:coenzyme F420-0:L-glutamate ligase / coenzyme F420-1:gamma-L-glutamate ligase
MEMTEGRSPLVLTPLIGIPMVKPGDDLAGIILKAIQDTGINLIDNDVLVIAQKIVSKAEGRFVNLIDVQPSKKAEEIASVVEKDPRFVEMILQESRVILRVRKGTIIVEHNLGFVCANAGIDHSNVQGLWGDQEDWILLLPVNPDVSAEQIRYTIQEKNGINVAVLIIDSHGRAWRMGVVGITIGVSGLPALVDMRGQEDLLGYHLKVTQIAAADELAAAASLIMGQAAEGSPVIHVRGFPYPLRESSLRELIRPEEQDLFR